MSNNPFAKYLHAYYVDPYASGGMVADFDYAEQEPIPDTKKTPTSLEVMPNGVDGCTCTKCNLFYAYAVYNQKNKTYICYPCRLDW